MTPTELTITLLFLIGAWFANKSYEAYLESKKELARIDADKEKTDLLQRVLEYLAMPYRIKESEIIVKEDNHDTL